MLDVDLPELGVVRPARACRQQWSQMKGDGRVRVCAACHCKVFNVAEISSEEARQLIRKSSDGDRIEARIFQRPDGTLLTRDCPKGRHPWKWGPIVRGAALTLVTLLVVGAGMVSLFEDNIRRLFAVSADHYTIGPCEHDGPPNLRMVRQISFDGPPAAPR